MIPQNIDKSSYYNLPLDIGFILFTPIKGCIDSLTVYICLVFISGALRLPEKYEKPICGITPNIRHGPGISSYYNLPPDIGFILFTPIKGCIDSLTVYIYKAETCTNILRYNTCMSSYPPILAP
jgi:hypothetical protein